MKIGNKITKSVNDIDNNINIAIHSAVDKYVCRDIFNLINQVVWTDNHTFIRHSIVRTNRLFNKIKL